MIHDFFPKAHCYQVINSITFPFNDCIFIYIYMLVVKKTLVNIPILKSESSVKCYIRHAENQKAL